jgi:hypothetical protein
MQLKAQGMVDKTSSDRHAKRDIAPIVVAFERRHDNRVAGTGPVSGSTLALLTVLSASIFGKFREFLAKRP